MPGTVSDNLVDFTDFLPTLANISNTPIPDNYGTLDGHSFYQQLTGTPEGGRNWVFCHYIIDTVYNRTPSRWVQNNQYKLYNKGYFHAPGFYNLQNDILETNALPDDQLTPEELVTKQSFQQVKSSYVKI